MADDSGEWHWGVISHEELLHFRTAHFSTESSFPEDIHLAPLTFTLQPAAKMVSLQLAFSGYCLQIKLCSLVPFS